MERVREAVDSFTFIRLIKEAWLVLLSLWICAETWIRIAV